MALLCTLSFLLIFSLTSSASLEKMRQQKTSLVAFQNNYALQRRAKDLEEAITFDQVRGDPKPKTKKEAFAKPQEEEIKAEPTPRSYVVSKLNLYQLLKADASQSALEELYCTLFERLYHQEAFYYENLAQELLNELQKNATASRQKTSRNTQKETIETLEDLAQLKLDNEKLQNILYKVLKGSQIVGQKGGYPPFSDYLQISKNQNTEMNLYTAPFELLAALFDEVTAHYITLNKKNWRQELQSGKSTSRQIKEKIISYYGKDFSKFNGMTTFQIRPE